MKGNKKYLRVDCHVTKKGKEFFIGRYRQYPFGTYKYVSSIDNLYSPPKMYMSTYDEEVHKFDSSDECIKVLRRLYLKEINYRQYIRDNRVVKIFKFWP